MATRTPEQEREALAKVLLAEYSMLLASLTATWSVVMSRTTLVLMVLSSISVALALAVNAAGFGDEFLTFAGILLSMGLFIGIVSYERVVQSSRETIVYVRGMNRIRHFFTEYAPRSADYFVLSTHDDDAGLLQAQGSIQLGRPRSVILTYGLPQVPGMLGVINSVVAAVIAAVVLMSLGASRELTVLGAAVVFVAVLAALLTHWRRVIESARTAFDVRFPSPPG